MRLCLCVCMCALLTSTDLRQLLPGVCVRAPRCLSRTRPGVYRAGARTSRLQDTGVCVTQPRTQNPHSSFKHCVLRWPEAIFHQGCMGWSVWLRPVIVASRGLPSCPVSAYWCAQICVCVCMCVCHTQEVTDHLLDFLMAIAVDNHGLMVLAQETNLVTGLLAHTHTRETGAHTYTHAKGQSWPGLTCLCVCVPVQASTVRSCTVSVTGLLYWTE